MASIYQISDKYKFIQSLIEDGAPEESFIEALESIDGELSEKLENYAAVIKNIESDASGIKLEEERLNKRRKYMENSIKRMKKVMEDAMFAAGQSKVKGEKFSFNIQKNPPSLVVLDENLVPEIFFNQQAPILDKKLVLESLKAGYKHEGVEIWQTKSIRIR